MNAMFGALRDSTGQLHPLAARTDVGRAPSRLVRVASPHASQHHAELRFVDDRWVVIDTQSRNGTRVNGLRLEPGVPRPLHEGDRLVFGGTDAGEWVLVSAAPPTALARRVRDGRVVVATEGTVYLPAPDEVEAVVYADPDGAWWCEQGGRAEPVADEATVLLSEPWTLRLPPSAGRTVPLPSGLALDTVALHLRADRTGEHVEAWLEHAEGRTSLGAEGHWSVAWVLASDRASDAAPEHERGWMDSALVAREMGVLERSLDTYYSRIRQAFRDARVEDAHRAIEARPHQRRLGIRTVVLHRSE